MNITSPHTIVEIAHRELLEIDSVGLARIVCLRGTVWVTRHRDPQDYVLTAGQAVAGGACGHALLQGLGNAAVALVAAPRTHLAGWLRHAAALLLGPGVDVRGRTATLSEERAV